MPLREGPKALLLALEAWILHRRRRKTPPCPRGCGKMRHTRTAPLTPVQETEIRIGSRSHDAWSCPGCGLIVTVPHDHWFARYETCSSCSARAVVTETRVLVRPGLDRESHGDKCHLCLHCGHERFEALHLPELFSTKEP